MRKGNSFYFSKGRNRGRLILLANFVRWVLLASSRLATHMAFSVALLWRGLQLYRYKSTRSSWNARPKIRTSIISKVAQRSDAVRFGLAKHRYLCIERKHPGPATSEAANQTKQATYPGHVALGSGMTPATWRPGMCCCPCPRGPPSSS